MLLESKVLLSSIIFHYSFKTSDCHKISSFYDGGLKFGHFDIGKEWVAMATKSFIALGVFSVELLTKIFVLSNELIKVELQTVKDLESWPFDLTKG